MTSTGTEMNPPYLPNILAPLPPVTFRTYHNTEGSDYLAGVPRGAKRSSTKVPPYYHKNRPMRALPTSPTTNVNKRYIN